MCSLIGYHHCTCNASHSRPGKGLVCSMCVLKYGYQIDYPFILCVYLFVHVAMSYLMQDIFGETALMAASQQGRIECATVLLKHRADVNYQNKVRLLYTCGVNMVMCYRMWITSLCWL